MDSALAGIEVSHSASSVLDNIIIFCRVYLPATDDIVVLKAANHDR